MSGQASLMVVKTGLLEPIVDLVTDSVTSENSRRAYRKALGSFLAWYAASGRTELNKAAVQAYKTHLQAAGLAPSTINLALTAVRKLGQEAADNGLIDQMQAAGIARAKGVKSAGRRAGNWLTKRQAQELLCLPDVTTRKGLRDRAILAVMLGCGLRRSEVAALEYSHIQQRDGRWAVVDLVGKGLRVRTVPMPSWAKAAIDAWAAVAGESTGKVFRSMRRGGHLDGAGMTDQAIADVVREYAGELGVDLAAHDLRRTYAKLAHKGGAPIDQISQSLGHAQIQTTQRYLGLSQDFTDAPCDRLGLSL